MVTQMNNKKKRKTTWTAATTKTSDAPRGTHSRAPLFTQAEDAYLYEIMEANDGSKAIAKTESFYAGFHRRFPTVQGQRGIADSQITNRYENLLKKWRKQNRGGEAGAAPVQAAPEEEEYAYEEEE